MSFLLERALVLYYNEVYVRLRIALLITREDAKLMFEEDEAV